MSRSADFMSLLYSCFVLILIIIPQLSLVATVALFSKTYSLTLSGPRGTCWTLNWRKQLDSGSLRISKIFINQYYYYYYYYSVFVESLILRIYEGEFCLRKRLCCCHMCTSAQTLTDLDINQTKTHLSNTGGSRIF